MNHLRLTCVIPAWWPAMGRSQYLLGELTRYFRTRNPADGGDNPAQRDWDLDIVSAVLPDHPSAGFELDGFPTVRVGNQYGFHWRRKSFSQNAVREISGRGNPPDVVMLFDMNDHIPEFRSGQHRPFRLIVRYDSVLESGTQAPMFAQRRLVRSLALADEIWVANHRQMDDLRLHGIPASGIRLVPDCVMPDDVDLPQPRDPDSCRARLAARTSLCSVYDGLKNAMDNSLVVCTLPTSLHQAMTSLIRTWRIVVREMPQAVLWLVGESVRTRDVMEMVQQLDLDGNVCFPGSFDSLDEVMLAANLLVHPAKTDEFAVGLLTGLRSGRAALAVRSESPVERWLQHECNVFLLDEFNPPLAAKHLVGMLRRQESLDQVGRQAREDVAIFRHPRWFGQALEGFHTGVSSPDQFGAAL